MLKAPLIEHQVGISAEDIVYLSHKVELPVLERQTHYLDELLYRRLNGALLVVWLKMAVLNELLVKEVVCVKI